MEKQVVVFKVGPSEYALPVAHIQEIIRIPSITSVPNVPGYFKGIISLRDNVLPIIDLGLKLGSARDYTEQSRIIIINHEGNIMGLTVDLVSEVLKIPEESIENPTFNSAYADIIEGITRYNERLILFLSITKLLN